MLDDEQTSQWRHWHRNPGLWACLLLWGLGIWCLTRQGIPLSGSWLLPAVWAITAALAFRMGEGLLQLPWRLIFPIFLWIGLLKTYPHPGEAWSALFAWGAVCLIRPVLARTYAGKSVGAWLAACGCLCGFAFWLYPLAGMALAGGIAAFSWLHAFLHEREEKGLTIQEVSNPLVTRRWAVNWGRYWALPVLLTAGGLCLIFTPAVDTPPINGYFHAFDTELMATITPFHWTSPCRLLYLIALGLLPVVGILGIGYRLPDRFLSRLLQRGDEEWLLLWLCGAFLLLASFFGGTSSQVIAYGGMPCMLAFIWFQPDPRLRRTDEREPLHPGWLFVPLFLMGVSMLYRPV